MDGAVYQWAFLSEVSGTGCTSISRLFNVDRNYKSQYSRSIVKKQHLNYLATTSPLGPLSLTLLKEEGFFKVIIRSREGMYCIWLSNTHLSVGIEMHSVESSNCKSHSLEDILKGMKLSVPCSFLQLCQDSSLPRSLEALEAAFLHPNCQFAVFARDHQSASFQSFLCWLYHGDDDVSDDLQVDVDHQLIFEGQTLLFSSDASTNILIIFQEDGDEHISFIENVTANIVIVVTQETELAQLGMDVVVRTNLFHHCQHLHLPSPSLFLKTNPDRQFILRMVVNLYHILLSTILFSKLKSQRHTLMYNLCDEFLLTHSVG